MWRPTPAGARRDGQANVSTHGARGLCEFTRSCAAEMPAHARLTSSSCVHATSNSESVAASLEATRSRMNVRWRSSTARYLANDAVRRAGWRATSHDVALRRARQRQFLHCQCGVRPSDPSGAPSNLRGRALEGDSSPSKRPGSLVCRGVALTSARIERPNLTCIDLPYREFTANTCSLRPWLFAQARRAKKMRPAAPSPCRACPARPAFRRAAYSTSPSSVNARPCIG